MRTFVIFVLCITIQPVWTASDAKDRSLENLRDRLDSVLTRLEKTGYSGAVLVAQDGKIILHKGYGLADRERDIRNTPETLFSIASITKVFTAAAILKLEMQGKLKTSDLISLYLGAFPKKKSGARIHHLLTHTSGLVIKGARLDYSSRQAFVKSVKETPVAAKPGKQYQYLNAGYSLLAAIIEEVSGLPFETYLQKYIFDPAGMTSTGFGWDQRFNALVAVGYEGDDLASLKPAPRLPNNWENRGPSGVVTTVGDMYKWIQALSTNLILSPKATRKMFTAYVGDEGYGWHVKKTRRGTTVVFRGGGLPEAESELRWYIEGRTVVAVTINNHIGFRKSIVEAFERIMRKK
jgi:CubicO group peptidase (beta-lactamase class C family)